MKDKLVTLIGGGGFLGRYVAQALLRQGVRVRIAQRRPREAWFLKPQGGLGQTQFVLVDVTLPETVARAVEGSDAVVNLAGTLHAADYHAIHVKGAQTVAQAASRAGASAFVHVSALGADAASPSGYGKSKAAGERAVLEAFKKAVILRPSYLFGREDRLVNRFAAMIASWGVVPVLAPEAKAQPLWVADAADAVTAALGDPGAHGGKTYSLGGPDVLTMAGLNRWIAREIGRDPLFLDLPDAIGALVAAMPGSPLSGDQWKMLKRDNIVPAGAPGMAALGLSPVPLASVAPSWLVQYRRHGRFGQLGSAA
ncbi:complex I NDUFA9 subunit family protein [Sphingomonas canadensis]|uniref:Complex I NDUFA9 subunit family protein n=1 Tax=Sphingomonas canadensis TaxID=1219257 RepID=A0ABW3H0N1_9SPHN|nr:complex I NDUFA9 subunit family protein [Sphingomonas canadensis]MCW3835081.1 complex I NDUFA9 subunit family protein [Sphingomonas canadensis]